jgi:hypothetical protein
MKVFQITFHDRCVCLITPPVFVPVDWQHRARRGRFYLLFPVGEPDCLEIYDYLNGDIIEQE